MLDSEHPSQREEDLVGQDVRDNYYGLADSTGESFNDIADRLEAAVEPSKELVSWLRRKAYTPSEHTSDGTNKGPNANAVIVNKDDSPVVVDQPKATVDSSKPTRTA